MAVDGKMVLHGQQFGRFDTLEIELRLVQSGWNFSNVSSLEQTYVWPGYRDDLHGMSNFPTRRLTYGGKRLRFNNTFQTRAIWKQSYFVRFQGQHYFVDPEITNTD